MSAAGNNHDQPLKKKVLTDQQTAIINSTGNLRINAVAGSGKTTTIIEYAASRPANARILYLAFNKSVKLEATRKFAEYGLTNTKVETAHSLAYKHVVFRLNYKVKAQGYKNSEICQLLDIRGNEEKHAEFVIANHISKFVTYFCNSDKAKVQDLNYLDTVVDAQAKTFVRTFYKFIEDGTRLLLAKMDRGEIEITHDFYLKKFQLSNPALPYDYILFDEAQDASAAMLDVFMKQKATKVIVGDTHQQIYGWRHAVNSLDKADFNTLQLSASFRFTQDIANLATEILSWKNHLFECKPVVITGKGASKKEVTKATIARTNLGLLLKAIEYITDNSKVKHIYFEGNISSYMYADDGASLYDVLSLYNGNHDRIRDKLVGSMKDMDDLEEYVEKTEDHQLATMIEIVREYGNEVHGIIKSLKELHTGDEDRHKAEMIFSTVHRSKGMEYDVVYLVNDFLSESKLKELKEKHKSDKTVAFDTARLNEEINLLYVAITRTKNNLHIPETLLPKEFPVSPRIIKVKIRETNFDYNSYFSEKAAAASKQTPAKKKPITKPAPVQAYTVFRNREVNKDANKPWTEEQDEELKDFFDDGTSISKIAAHFGRTRGAIIARLKKLDIYFDE
jgi:superfamily I DNA/RNA helicase